MYFKFGIFKHNFKKERRSEKKTPIFLYTHQKENLFFNIFTHFLNYTNNLKFAMVKEYNYTECLNFTQNDPYFTSFNYIDTPMNFNDII